MFRNYLKTSLRNLIRFKGFAFIKITGLALGMAIWILIFQYVHLEHSFDRFHENKQDIYRFTTAFQEDTGEWDYMSVAPIPLGPAIAEHYPEIENVTRFINRTTIVSAGTKSFRESLVFTEPAFFDMFSFDVLQGNPGEALKDKYNVVLTQSTAEKYFGEENPIGKTLAIKHRNEFNDFTVSAVVEDVPYNSTLQFNFLLPYETIIEQLYYDWVENWGAFTTRTYIQLAEGADPVQLEQKVPQFLDSFLRPIFDERVDRARFHLQPMTDIHLNTSLTNRYEPVNNPVYLQILLAIGSFILILACINVINLGIGQATTRFKEMGARRIFGSGRTSLIMRLLGESILLSFMSLLIALVLVEILIPLFNHMANTHISIGVLFNPITIPVLLGLVLLVAIISGGYPAFHLSRFRPAEIVKGSAQVGGPSFFTRVLVILQFAFSIFFIICTFTMSRQLQFLNGQNLGFDDDHVVVIPTLGQKGDQVLEIFRNELGAYPAIKNIAGCGESLGRMDDYGLILTEVDGVESGTYIFRIDENYIATMGMEILQGRNFSAEYPTDATKSVIVNEAFVKTHNLENPLGKRFEAHFGSLEDGKGTIIGVVKDFNFLSLHTEIEPALLHVSPNRRIAYVLVRIDPMDISKTIALLRDTWTGIAPHLPFDYYFLDEDFNRQYIQEENWRSIFTYSSLFAILIASLGLFGISILALSRRTKEIGIRKVLGATASGLVRVVTKEFVMLVLIANLVAWPVAFYILDKWLQNFAYRITVGIDLFIVAGLLTLLTALVTVSIQVFRAVVANPVNALRYE
jgi:putative ABC transport system permease protein